jgi:predicted nucleotidyltransferase component of viral defense system
LNPSRSRSHSKGGTALKKCYFGDYRFSEDLDFSCLEGAETGDAMERAVREACDAASRLLDEYAPVEIWVEPYIEKKPHPGGQEAFAIRARLPWQREPHTRVLIEVTLDEKVLKPVQRRMVIHGYGEPFQTELQVYALEEIVAEKLRAILQHAEKLEQRGWSRSRARDYYDLWRMLSAYKDQMDLSGFPSFLREKCAVRSVGFEGAEDFFQQHMLDYSEKTWDRSLGPLVPGLPSFATVLNELRPQIASLLQKSA